MAREDGLTVPDMFTVGIEKSIAGNKIASAGGDSAKQARHRHEAIAQHMLAYLLEDEAQLEAFADELAIPSRHGLLHRLEVPDGGPGLSRFDHVLSRKDDGQHVAVIEDKIDAEAGKNQLQRYCDHLHEQGPDGRLIVLHPERRRGEWGDPAGYSGAIVSIIGWHELGERMASRAGSSPGAAACWRALAAFAENVGTGDLSGLAPAAVLLDSSAAKQVRDLILTAQNVARAFEQNSTSRFRFSTDVQNSAPWLQFRLSTDEKNTVGMQVLLHQEPGRIEIGFRGPKNLAISALPTGIGAFPDGKLTEAATQHVRHLKTLGKDVEVGAVPWPENLEHGPLGRELDEDAQGALALLGMVFHAAALRNPHRGGATASAKAANEGENGERLGVVLSSAAKEVHLFFGPPVGEPWDRASIWIRCDGEEEEIVPEKGESGRQYVERVWANCRKPLAP